MKYFNEKMETVINTSLHAAVTKPANDEECLHNQIVNDVTLFIELENDMYKKIWLSKDWIFDIATQIKEIESRQVLAYYDSLPF